MPFSYTPNIVNSIFNDIDKVNFLTLCVKIFGFRAYSAASNPHFD